LLAAIPIVQNEGVIKRLKMIPRHWEVIN